MSATLRRRPHRAVIRFSKIVVISMLLSAGIFTITMIVTFFVTGGVPDTLITEFFGFFKVEGGALGIIKVAETIQEAMKGRKKDGDSQAEIDIT